MPFRAGRLSRTAVIGHPVVRMLPLPGARELIDHAIRRRATTSLPHNGSDARAPTD